jgi:hypothetical protein
MRDGIYQEYGILARTKDNDTIYFEGALVNGLFDGEIRCWTKDWETRYWGGFKDSQYTGQAILITPEYNYEGEFKSHKKEGRGCLLDKATGIQYEGTFLNGKKEGEFKVTEKGKTQTQIFSNDVL